VVTGGTSAAPFRVAPKSSAASTMAGIATSPAAMTMTVKKRFIIVSPFQAQDRALQYEDTVATKSRFSRALRPVAALRAVAALCTSVLLVVAGGALARGADAAVSVVDFAFQPPTITVDAGATVTWTVTRAQDPHTVTPVDPPDAFVGSPLLRQGDRFSVTFSQAGTYRYECTIHPEDMQGTVIVEAAQATPSPTAVATAPTETSTSSAPATDTPAPTASPAPLEPSGGGPPLIALVLGVLAAMGVAGWFLVTRWMRR
jgi:plastocyanin